MKTLQNEYLSIQIAERGAELCSIMCNDKEYLWQADPKFWGRHSPVLFPIVGKVWDDVYTVEGKNYPLSQHGFARDMDFELVSQSATEVTYRLMSTEETLKKYPFPFLLEITYRLTGKMIEVIWKVENIGSSELHFQIGAHPAFVYQDFDVQTNERGYFAFDKPKGLRYVCPVEKGCVSAEEHLLALNEDGLMPIHTGTFDCDTYIFENSQLGKIVLLDRKKQPVVSLQFNTPLVALWSPTKAYPDCPFVCIEPWYGRADSISYQGEYKDKDWMQHLEADKTFIGGYSITIA